MKRTVLLWTLGLALTVLSSRVQAQGYFNRAEEGQIKFGVRGGVNYFNLGSVTFDDDEDYEEFDFLNDIQLKTKSKVGFQVGAYADIWMSPAFSFMPEINVIRKSSKVNDSTIVKFPETDDPDLQIFDEITISANLSSEFYYVEAPLLLGYKPMPTLRLFAGPQVSYLIFQKLTAYNEDGTPDTETYGADELQKLMIGGAAGAQFDFMPNINVNARYVTDFQSAFKKEWNLSKMRHSGISLSIGYTF